MVEIPVNPGTLSVILPCYNEKENISFLIEHFEALDSDSTIARIIFVDDDSPDGTAEFIKSLPPYKFDLLCLSRVGRQGLSSAVVEGLLLADTPYVAVMDADGQHSPKDLINMFAFMTSINADFVVGSRFLQENHLTNHAGFRGAISKLGNGVANRILNQHLTDPLTGFFIMRRELMLRVVRKVKPTGFKILLDFLYHLKDQKIALHEYPISFANRHAGESKLDSRNLIEFVEQITGYLTKSLVPEKFLSFIFVGSIGLLVHLSLLYLFLFYGDLEFLMAQVLATGVSMVSNFTFNNVLTFRRNRLTGKYWIKGLLFFMLICSLGSLANVGVAGYLFSQGKVWWVSGILGVLVGTVFNFSLSRFYIWKS